MGKRVERLHGTSGWAPILLHDGDDIRLGLPIASGHFDFSVEVPVSGEEAAVLRSDERRYWLIYAATHDRLQEAGMNGPHEEILRPILDDILGDGGEFAPILRRYTAKVPNLTNTLRILSESRFAGL